jgi:hypothetical protein
MAPTPVGYVILTLIFEREGYKWVGTSEELSTSTYARTLKQCQRELEELVSEHLNLLEEEGERERFFGRWGIEVHPTKAPQEITFRVSGRSMPRFFDKPAAPSSPPFLLPRLFPVLSADPNREKRLVGA